MDTKTAGLISDALAVKGAAKTPSSGKTPADSEIAETCELK